MTPCDVKNQQIKLVNILCLCACRWSYVEVYCLLSRRRWPGMPLSCCMMMHFSVTWLRKYCSLRRSCEVTSHTQLCYLDCFISCLRKQPFRSGSLWKRRVSWDIQGYLTAMSLSVFLDILVILVWSTTPYVCIKMNP